MNTFRGTNLPWHEHPFRLISWLEMNKFSAESFYNIGVQLGNLITVFKGPGHPWYQFPKEIKRIINSILLIQVLARQIGLVESSKLIDRVLEDLDRKHRVPRYLTNSEVAIHLDSLRALISSEMESQLFLWIPGHRAAWYGKKAVKIAGKQWCARFKITIPEIQEASQCYAAGRYTAAAFHLMRATEAGTNALGRAIGLTPAHPGWKLVFDEVYAQFKNKKPRHSIWATHESHMVKISGDLRTISHVWRNDLAHFVDTYGEEDAREMFTVIPIFMRHLSAMIDENGKLY